jgi:TQXA domain-containing protein/LPXTG-motif cell wall-anchored protein
VSRVKKLRVGAALIGVTATALMAAAIPAAADAATGKIEGVAQTGVKVKIKDSKGVQDFDTELFKLVVGDSVLQTYCVGLHTDVDPKKKPDYVEVPWNKHPNPQSSFAKNAANINWVLHYGYPTVKEADLQKVLETNGAKFPDKLSREEALAGTQAAVWHYSDGAELDADATPGSSAQTAADVREVFKYLTGAANKGIADQPKPELTLEPKKLSGKPGDLIGPFAVSTNAKDLVLKSSMPTGVKLTDKAGNELPKADAAKTLASLDKYEFYVKVPADMAEGKAEITISGESTLTLGRLFISTDPVKNPSQEMILAKTDTVPLQTQGEANWTAAAPPTSETPQPQPKNTNDELANTGASVLMPVVIGVVLVGAGVGALVFQRRRRRV